MEKIIGRKEEQKLLKKVLHSKEAELVAIYGRRRVGKTFLIHSFFEDHLAFELTGIYGGSLEDQLQLFSKALEKATGYPIKKPGGWIDAFQLLEQYLAGKSKRRKSVVFLDEFPWMDTRRSGFLAAFGHFWNTWASRQSHLIVAICGSAASWMIRNIVNNKGGLHHRITQKIHLEPFTLQETETYLTSRGVKMDRYQILQIYMAFGGIPQYLKSIEQGSSAAQAIQQTCFDKNGFLSGEFKNLYGSLFEKADQHIQVVRALAGTPKGMNRQQIIQACSLTSGGWTTRILDELEKSGFIQSMLSYEYTGKDAIYRLTDEYSLFYLKFMEKHRSSGKDGWVKLSTGNIYKIWCGMAFEALCLKHIQQIKEALGIESIPTQVAAWHYVPGKGADGAQVDLLIDRSDHVINLCEIKFYTLEFTIEKSYAGVLQRKLTVFKQKTGTRKTVLLTMVTTYGLKENEYSRKLVDKSLSMDVLFE